MPGDTEGVLDWDSQRFFEAFFAIPMMGAVVQTVNVRLSPEHVAYTIDHAGASTLLVNDEFVGLLEGLKAQLPKVKRLIVMSDRPAPETGVCPSSVNMSAFLARLRPPTSFPISTRIPGDDLPYGAQDRIAQGVYYSHRQLVLHTICGLALFGMAELHGRFSRDVYAWGFPGSATLAGVKQVYPGRYEPVMLVKLIKNEGVAFTHGVPTILQMLRNAAAAENVEGWWVGFAEGAGQTGALIDRVSNVVRFPQHIRRQPGPAGMLRDNQDENFSPRLSRYRLE